MEIKDRNMERIIDAIEFKSVFNSIDKPAKITSAGYAKDKFYLLIEDRHVLPFDFEQLEKVIASVKKNKWYRWFY